MKDTPHLVQEVTHNEKWGMVLETLFWVGHRWTAWEKPPGQRPFRRCLDCPAVEVKRFLP